MHKVNDLDLSTQIKNWWQPKVVIAVLCVLYAVGIVGIVLPLHEQFILLTPLNLLVSLGLVLAFHRVWNNRMLGFLAIAYLVGFLVELLGIQTGVPFGNYEYGPVLGLKIWGTPLMIGVNWVLLTYCIGVTTNHLLPTGRGAVKALLAAFLMVALDCLIEPVAMAYNFWSWEEDVIPLHNYAGWFAVALPLQLLFQKWVGNIQNKVAVALFLLQILFFSVLNMVH